MNGNCHFIFGASVGTSVAVNIGLVSDYLPNIAGTAEMGTLFVMGGILGSILPDIDNPTSYVGKLTVPVSTLIGSIGKVTGKTGKRHRGLLHDGTFYLLGIVLSYFCFAPLIGFFLGCLSHLFLDLFNPSGIPILFGANSIRLGTIPSGSVASVIFTWICVVVMLSIGFLCKFVYFQN